MFSATKFVVAAVIVALFGGFLLVSLPFEQQGMSVPGAASGGPGVFSPAGSLAEARSGHTATLLPDGRVLVVGGGEDDPPVEVWDPETATFSPAGSPAEARVFHTATLLPDGRVLVVGGGDGNGRASAEVWDPETAAFEPAGSLAEARFQHTATLLPDGRVFIVGGDENYGDSSAEVWDPETATFGPKMPLPTSRVREYTATTLSDGRVLIVGGKNGYGAPTGSNDDRYGQPAVVWDPATASFSPAGRLAEARWRHTATLLPDDRVLVVGGGDGDPDEAVFASAEVWDPATESFGPVGSLAEARSFHTATLLLDGRVLVIGGGDEDGAASVVEVWDPETAAFSPAASLAEARTSHTATLLPDGRVLVVGGWREESAEIWSP